MPDYCNNYLHIEGDDKIIDDLINKVVDDDRDPLPFIYLLDNLFPCPKELSKTISGFLTDPDEQAKLQRAYDDNIAKYGYKCWYDWCVANWGTKWSDDETILISRTEGKVVFSFVTPYAPPEKAFAKISTDYPDLIFVLSYMSDSLGYVGATGFRNGNAWEMGSDNSSLEGIEPTADNYDAYYGAFIDHMKHYEKQILEQMRTLNG